MATYPGKIGTFWIPLEVMNFLDEKIKKAYLEIGVFDGVVISLLAEKHPDKKFVGVDAFIRATETGAGSKEFVLENTKYLKNFTLLEGKSLDILPTIKEMFDIIFIDGDHSYETTKFDSELSWNLLEIGGILAFHDYNLLGVKKAVDELGEKYNLKLKLRTGVVYYEK